MCGYFCIGFIDFMFEGKKLIDYTNLFSPYDFDENDQIILSYFKDAWNRYNKIIRSNKIQSVWNKKIENCFINEINEKESFSKKLNKYVTIFDCIDKLLIVLSETSSSVSIISFTSTIDVPVGIVSASFTLIFSITTGIIKKLLSTTIKKKKKHDQILKLAKSKYDSIEALISQALNDIEVSHKEFITILNEKNKYEKMKEDIEEQKIVK